MQYYWGTPLEMIARELITALWLNIIDPNTAYKVTKQLIHDFNKINPNFWNE